MVLSRLLCGFFIFGGHFVPLSNRLLRGRCTANGLFQIATVLYELNDILHRLFVLVAARLFVFIDWVQLNITVVSVSENLSVLGVHGSNGTAHKLSKRVQIDGTDTLFTCDFPLERLLVSFNL